MVGSVGLGRVRRALPASPIAVVAIMSATPQ